MPKPPWNRDESYKKLRGLVKRCEARAIALPKNIVQQYLRIDGKISPHLFCGHWLGSVYASFFASLCERISHRSTLFRLISGYVSVKVGNAIPDPRRLLRPRASLRLD